MPKFQIEATVTGRGYIDLEAESAADARRKVQSLNPEISFPMQDRFAIDLSLFDLFADIHIDNVVEDTDA
jgi:hypothetical protein